MERHVKSESSAAADLDARRGTRIIGLRDSRVVTCHARQIMLS
jgi:hypothetical protein